MPIDTLPMDDVKHAVALKYSQNSAPVLVAKGSSSLADEIIKLAEENGVPLCDNAVLVDLLQRIELGEEVPRELYVAVAYILAFALEISQSTPQT